MWQIVTQRSIASDVVINLAGSPLGQLVLVTALVGHAEVVLVGLEGEVVDATHGDLVQLGDTFGKDNLHV
jgi:hypothetical protein